MVFSSNIHKEYPRAQLSVLYSEFARLQSYKQLTTNLIK